MLLSTSPAANACLCWPSWIETASRLTTTLVPIPCVFLRNAKTESSIEYMTPWLLIPVSVGDFVQYWQNAQLGLSAFVRSMREMSKVALVRRVYTSNNRVQIGVLCPRIGPDYEVRPDTVHWFFFLSLRHFFSTVFTVPRNALRRRVPATVFSASFDGKFRFDSRAVESNGPVDR